MTKCQNTRFDPLAEELAEVEVPDGEIQCRIQDFRKGSEPEEAEHDKQAEAL